MSDLHMAVGSMRRRTMFTLVELLVVVAVISILMAMLLPALSSAKSKGQEIACRSNLKQLGLVAMSYSGDYDNWCISGVISGGIWTNTLRNLDYFKSDKMMKCPSEPVFNIANTNRVNYGVNHGTFGAWVGHANEIPQRMQSISKFGRDSSLLYFIDTPPTTYKTVGIGFSSDTSAYVSPDGGIYPIIAGSSNYPIYVRHNLRANAAIFDGHVTSFGRTELTTDRNNIWNPFQSGCVLKIVSF